MTVPPEVFDSAAQLIKAGGSANLTFWLPAVSGDAVALSFDLATIFQMGGLARQDLLSPWYSPTRVFLLHS